MVGRDSCYNVMMKSVTEKQYLIDIGLAKRKQTIRQISFKVHVMCLWGRIFSLLKLKATVSIYLSHTFNTSLVSAGKMSQMRFKGKCCVMERNQSNNISKAIAKMQ